MGTMVTLYHILSSYFPINVCTDFTPMCFNLMCRVQASASAGSSLRRGGRLEASLPREASEAAAASSPSRASDAAAAEVDGAVAAGRMTKKRSSLMYENWSTVRMCESDFRTHDT